MAKTRKGRTPDLMGAVRGVLGGEGRRSRRPGNPVVREVRGLVSRGARRKPRA